MGLVAAGQALGLEDMSLTALLIAAGAAIAAMVAAYFKGTSAGRNSEKVKRIEADANTRREYDKIDAAAPDLDAAVDRLRRRVERNAPPK